MARGKKRRPKRPSTRRPAPERHELDLRAELRAALADEHPHALLDMVAALLVSVELPDDPFDPEPDADLPTLDEFVDSFVQIEARETTGVLAAIAELTSDDLLRARIRRVLAGRPHVLPPWLERLGGTEVVAVSEMVHVLGDGDDVMVELAFPGGQALTVVIYIDHNLGTVVKDAFTIPEPLAAVTKLIKENTDADTTVRALDPADARARITEAVELGRRMLPPLESDTWPLCRPLVEWAARLLPAGGAGYERPEWDDASRDHVAHRFLSSPFAVGLDEDQRDLLGSLIWFGTDYGPGDPLRWSPVAVEILLLDWIPRKIVAEAAFLAKAPDLLRAFIRFSHAERGIRAALTAETLATVDSFEPDYQQIIRSPRPQGPAALLDAMGLFDDEMPADPEQRVASLMLSTLRRTVGSDEALRSLDGDPLPDEPFDRTGIPDDVHDRVSEVLALLDEGCVALFDREFRTACRRFLTDAAAGDPSVFRGRTSAANTAAAVCWVVGKANDLLTYDGGLLVKDLTAHFGASSNIAQRAGVLIAAAGLEHDGYGPVQPGTPRYLVSGMRQSIVDRRDHYLGIQE